LRGRPSWSTGRALPWLIRKLDLYLTDFLKRTFPGENAKIHAFCGVEIFRTRRVYQSGVNHGTALKEIDALVTQLNSAAFAGAFSGGLPYGGSNLLLGQM
jgi:hypothetical protein